MAAVVLTQLHPISVPGIGTLPARRYLGWQITPSTPADLETSFTVVGNFGGYTGTAIYDPSRVNGQLTAGGTWTITLTKPGYPDQKGGQNDWIIFDGDAALMLTNTTVTANYTANVPLAWAPTTVAPVATAKANGQATIAFPQPTSVNGPWTYTVTQTDVTTSTTGSATIAGTPSIDGNGNVTLTVDGLTAGDYTFTVTVTATQYSGVTATSLASNQTTIP